MTPRSIQRSVLLAPDAIARACARYATDRAERWLLLQPRRVRRSYAVAVLGAGGPHAERIWMLRQHDEVRESYVREVLEAGSGDVAAAAPVDLRPGAEPDDGFWA